MVLAKGEATLLLSHILIILLLLIPPLFRFATPPAVFVTDPRVRRQIVRIIGVRCAMTFIRDRGYGVRPRGEKPAQKSHRLNIAPNFDES